jgi:hypothetical protein
MKINEMQLYGALNEFIERDIMPLGASMDIKNQFIFGIAIGIVKRKMQDVVKSYIHSDVAKMLGLVDENGAIDIDTIYQSASDAFANIKQIDIAGITFKESDLQNLYGIMQKYAG